MDHGAELTGRRHVVHLSTVHDCKDNRIFQKECKGLAAAGYRVEFICARADEERIEDGVRVIPLGRRRGGRLRRMSILAIATYRAAIDRDADIYHFHDPELLTVGVLLRMWGKTVVYDVHEDLPRQLKSKSWIPAMFRNVLSGMVEDLENLLAARMSAIVTVTDLIEQRFKQINPRCVQVRNYPLPAAVESFRKPLSERARKVSYIGGISGVRGAYDMLELKRHIEGELKIAGPLQDAAIADHPDWESVYCGMLDRAGVLSLLGDSRIGLLLLHPIENYLEALPVKLFEYMQAALPVVAYDFGLQARIIRETGCGILVPPGDIEATALAINDLLADSERMQMMGLKGQAAVQQEYAWASQVEKLVALYEQL